MGNEISEHDELVIPDELPLLPIRDVVVYPYMIIPLFVGREPSIRAVNEALAKDRLIFLAAQKEVTDENPSPESIFPIGTISMIMRMRKLPDGRVKILVQGLMKGTIVNFQQDKPFFVAQIKQIKEKPALREQVEVEALMRTVRENLEKVISMGRMLSPDILMVVDDINDGGRLADLIASNLGLKVEDAQAILEQFDPFDRLKKVNEILVKELEILAMQARIRSQARDEMTKSQREYFLREQIRAIKNELGDTESKSEEIQELRNKIEACKMPAEVYEEAIKQVGRLERMHQDASEATIVRTYLDWIVDIPWSKSTEDTLDLNEAQRILDEDHFDLKKIKERILEFLAVRKLKPKMKGPILCFVGPPGVGKTSLGKSIARAMGRKFVRISLGGIRDEADIRGHRRTYVGAMPGRIIQGLKQAGSANPIFVLDEIDKLGQDFRGDPASALLEVLDPEQNFSFRDHYLNLPYDLSNVMFIATANLMDTVPSALRDRMEVIQLSGYSQEEKLQIAKRFIIGKQREENGLKPEEVEVSDKAVARIVNQYTQEAGLRNLERNVAAIFRKLAQAQVTLLFDECDAIFAKRGDDGQNEDLRALINSGYRRGASIPRCVGSKHEVQDFTVYAANALAGLGDLPDTIMSRSVIIRMRKRSAAEHIEPFRTRVHEAPGHKLRDRLAAWAETVSAAAGAAWPALPPGIEDRRAEIWEPLIAVADQAGGQWPGLSRTACLALCAAAENRRASLGVRLLGDLKTIFGDADTLPTNTVLARLCGTEPYGTDRQGENLHIAEDAPWSELRGKPLDSRGLARLLHKYDVGSAKIKYGGRALQGYRRVDLWDAWQRYLTSTLAEAEPMEPSELTKQTCGFTADSMVPAKSTVPEPAIQAEPEKASGINGSSKGSGSSGDPGTGLIGAIIESITRTAIKVKAADVLAHVVDWPADDLAEIVANSAVLDAVVRGMVASS